MQRLLLSALGRSFHGRRWIVASLLLVSVLVGFAGPAWWSQRGVLTPEAAPDDFALVNQGQLKQIALAAFREIEAKIPGGAGPELNAALDSWTNLDANNVRVAKVTPATDDFATVNLGQVRALAKPFYDRLYAVGRAQTYPWSDSPSDDDDFAFANIGQVKNVFSFDLGPGTPTGLTATPGNLQITLQWNAVPGATAYKVLRSATAGGPYQPLAEMSGATSHTDAGLADGATSFYVVVAGNGWAWSFPSNEASATAILDTDTNGLHDSWEILHFGAPGQDPAADPDGDGLSNLQEYKQGSNPLDFYNGQIPGLAVISGQDQTGTAGTPLPQPFTVRVTRNGAPLSNAPVSFTAPTPGLGATAGALQTQLTVRTNAAGDASCFFTLPAVEGTHTIQVAAGTATASFNATAYVVPAAPVFSFPAGNYATARSVTVSSATAGARIHYTLDGSEPTASSASVESGGVIPVTVSATLKARAVRPFGPLGGVTTAVYRITGMAAAGSAHTVALKSDGALWAWGLNTNGQLGDNSVISRPGPVSVLSGVASAAAGASHTVALKNDGSVWAWGLNTNGQLGDGTTTQRIAPVKITALSGVVAVAANGSQSAALKNDGTVWTWGLNTNGQLGDGTTTQRTAPVRVGALSGVTAIAVGTSHMAALKNDGTLWAWGLNTNGQLGDGSLVQRTAPVQVSGFTGATAVAAGGAHTLALKNDGTVWAWGLNSSGQLGDGTTTQRTAPVRISSLTGVGAVAAGAAHSAALRNDGTPVFWGGNTSGQLGDGTATARTTPWALPGAANAVSVIAGANHTFVLRNDGTLTGFGANASGQLGDGTLSLRNTAVQGVSLSGAATVSAGGAHTAAVRGDGTLRAWGGNTNGQLGDNTAVLRSAPVTPAGLTGLSAVSSGNLHTVALRTDGTLRAWGFNGNGQLGDNTVTKRAAPITVPGITGVTEVSAGHRHTAAVKADGTLWAWGLNTNGQLGDGSLVQRNAPVQVPGLTGMASVSAGVAHTVALKNDGSVWAWGLNTNGQLGNGATTQSAAPVQVTGFTGAIAVSAGATHSVALKNDGTVWAWGLNSNGQLGNGTITQRTVPVQVTGLTGVVAVSANAAYTLALKSDGTIWAWGLNSSGQLGDGTFTQRTAPVRVTGLTGVVAVSAGNLHAVALLADGTVRTWGNAGSGQFWLGPVLKKAALRLVPDASDLNQNAVADAWEQAQFGNTTTAVTLDPDLDGLSHIQEAELGSNPASANSDADLFSDLVDPAPQVAGTEPLPVFTQGPGNNQSALPGAFLAQPLETVVTLAGQPMANTPVMVRLTAGAARLALRPEPIATNGHALIARTDAQGRARVFVQLTDTAPSAVTFAGLPQPIVFQATTITTPPAPTGVTAAPGNAQVELAWPAVAGATSYKVQRSTTSGTGYADFAGNTTTNPTFTDTGLTNGTAYFYVVFAVNAGGSSPASAQATATPVAPPTAPTGVTAAPGNAQVTLTWTAVAGATSYKVQRSTISGAGYADFAGNTTITPTFTDTGLTNGTPYYYVVFAVNAGGTSPASTQATATPVAPPAAPTGVTAAPGNAQVTLNWPAVTGATSYKVQRSITSGTGYADFAGNTTATPTLTDIGLTNGTAYYYVVFAVNAGGTSPASAQVAATPVAPPAAPTGVTAAPGNARVTLTWPAVTGATSYKIQRSTTNGSGYADFAGNTTTNPTFTNTGLTNGTAYYYVVFAVNAGGTSPASAQATATPVAPPTTAPTSLTAVPGNARVSLTWSAVPGVTGYTVRRSTASGGGYVDLPGTTTPSLADTGLVNGTKYFYVVAATNAGGPGPNSTEISATPVAPPAAPTGVTATPGNARVTLSWPAVTGATSYKVQRSTTNGSAYTDFAGNTVTALTLTNTGLTNGTTYYYVVFALNAGGSSAPSAQAAATPVAPPSAPTGVTAAPGNAQVMLNWPAVAGATSYKVQRSTTSGTGYADFAGNTPATPPFTNTGLTNGTAYYYVVFALNAGGSSARSAQATATPIAPPTVAPSSLTAVPGNARVTLNWNAVPGATGYVVRRSITSGSGYVDLPGITTTSLLDTGLVNGTTYFYVVVATNAGGLGPVSTEISATPVAPPAAPTGLSATPGDGQIALSWNAVPGAAFYRVRRSITNGGGYADFSGNTVTGLTFTNTGLTNGTPYYYVVVASNAGGESLPSAQAGATPIAPPAAPTGLSAVPGNAQVSLSWNAVPGVTGYVVRRSTVSGGGYADFPGNTTAETTLVNTGLTNGTPYYYKVAATNAGGVGLFSTEAAATPVTPLLPPPNPVRAVALNGGAALHWDAVPGATAYKIRRSVAGNDVEFTSTEPAYMDQPLGNETTYSYTVRTVNEFGPGPDSAPVTVTPRVVLVFQDTNADGVDDAWAVQHFGTVNFATSGDADSDGLTNSAEYGAGTNPNNSDSDGDGFDDGEETEDGSDPKDPNSKPLRPPQNIRVEANYETYTITITWDPPANTSDQVVVEWALLPYSRHWRKWEAPVPEGSSIRVGLFGWPFIASPYVYRLRMMRGNRLSRPSAPVWNEPIKAYLEATSWYETDSFDLGSSPGVNFKGQQNFHGSPAPVDESWSTVGSVGDIIKEDVITFRYQWISDTKFAVLNEGSETYVFQRIKADDPPVDLLLHVSTVLSREGLGYGPVAMYLSGDWSDKPWRRWTEQKCVIYVPKVSLKIYNRKGKEIWDDYALIQANNNNDEGRPASNGVEPRDNDDDKADPSKDPDLVKVVLEGPTQTQTGKVQVVLPSGIRAFTESGELIESPDLEIDLANPTGQLAGLKQGPLTIYLEAQNNAQGGQFSIAQYASDFGTGKIHLLQKEYVNLLPVEVTVRKKGTAAAPDDGLLVKTGDVLEFALAPHFFDTEDNFESLINWQQRRLKSDGTYTEWLNIGAHAKGTKFEHTTAAGGIFQIKAVITNGGEYEYKRKKDAPHGSDSGGTVNPIYKKDELDYVGVCDAQWQMEVRCAAKSHLGSLAYGKSVDMPVYAGGPSTVDMPKCNIFVYHACTAGGVAVPLTTLSDGTQWPPTAKRWWSQNVAIAGWNNLLQTNEPQPGYVVSRPGAHVTIAGRDFIAAGHVGILDYDGAWINAGSKTVNKFPHLTPPRGEYQPARMREKK